MQTYQFKVNGVSRTVQADPTTPILWILRDHLRLTGTKYGCGIGQCGACTIHVERAPVHACGLRVSAVAGRSIVTIEGLAALDGGKLQAAWIAEQVSQCGYCQSGQLMRAAILLQHTPNPTDADIDLAMSGNLCRCGTYVRIRKAIHRAAKDAAAR
jgi:isoquinoline 1-oxidoreductase subunit alpha